MSIILFISLMLILLATLSSIILFFQAQDKRIVIVIGLFSLISAWLLTVAITETEQWFPIIYSSKVVEVPGLLLSVLSLLIVIALERVLADKVKRELLQSAILESQQALDKKSEFIAVMSHEIRTPLNTIIGINELLVDTKLTIYQKKLLEQCCLSGTNLQGIIEDILNLSEIEAGFLTLNNESYNLTETVERLVRQQKFSVQKKGLLIDVEFQSTVSGNLFGDRRKISQVMLNLITNATKYTDKGCISIKVSTEFISVDKVLVVFRVFDTGVGIPEVEKDKLFTWFSRLDSARTSGAEGTGLGLAICKNLVDYMGGEIGVES
jgi:two-component system, sensor histidine kinase